MLSRIKKRIQEFKEIKYLAYHDALTGLLNRNWLYKNMNDILLDYVYFIDINDLRKINEQGHTYGDKHINEIVNSINTIDNEILIRLAGDEFILFSNRNDAIKTNKLISVGCCKIDDLDLRTAINLADTDMIKSKERLKTK